MNWGDSKTSCPTRFVLLTGKNTQYIFKGCKKEPSQKRSKFCMLFNAFFLHRKKLSSITILNSFFFKEKNWVEPPRGDTEILICTHFFQFWKALREDYAHAWALQSAYLLLLCTLILNILTTRSNFFYLHQWAILAGSGFQWKTLMHHSNTYPDMN